MRYGGVLSRSLADFPEVGKSRTLRCRVIGREVRRRCVLEGDGVVVCEVVGSAAEWAAREVVMMDASSRLFSSGLEGPSMVEKGEEGIRLYGEALQASLRCQCCSGCRRHIGELQELRTFDFVPN